MEMQDKDIKFCRAIVMFGPATGLSGQRPAEYFQVTIDPNMTSPSGEFIRFGFHPGDEIVGWQRVEALTVCEILGEAKPFEAKPDGYTETKDSVVMRKVI